MLLHGPTVSATETACASADSERERVVCSDATLSTLARTVETLFQKNIAGVPPDAAQQLARNHEYWLNYIERKCGPVARAMNDDQHYTIDDEVKCLRDNYRGEIDRKDPITEYMNGHMFYYISRIDIRPDKDFISTPPENRSELCREADTEEVSLPQLVVTDPQDAQANTHIRSYARLKDIEAQIATPDIPADAPGASMDEGNWTKLIAYTDSLLVLDTATYEYGHGAGTAGTGNHSHFYLMKEGREMPASRVFLAGSHWQAFLSQRAYAELKKRGRVSSPPYFDTINSPKELKKIIVKPENWRFDAQGLTLLFNYDDLQPGFDKLTTVTIPWNELRPYLVKDSPVLDLAHVPATEQP